MSSIYKFVSVKSIEKPMISTSTRKGQNESSSCVSDPKPSTSMDMTPQIYKERRIFTQENLHKLLEMNEKEFIRKNLEFHFYEDRRNVLDTEIPISRVGITRQLQRYWTKMEPNESWVSSDARVSQITKTTNHHVEVNPKKASSSHLSCNQDGLGLPQPLSQKVCYTLSDKKKGSRAHRYFYHAIECNKGINFVTPRQVRESMEAREDFSKQASQNIDVWNISGRKNEPYNTGKNSNRSKSLTHTLGKRGHNTDVIDIALDDSQGHVEEKLKSNHQPLKVQKTKNVDEYDSKLDKSILSSCNDQVPQSEGNSGVVKKKKKPLISIFSRYLPLSKNQGYKDSEKEKLVVLAPLNSSDLLKTFVCDDSELDEKLVSVDICTCIKKFGVQTIRKNLKPGSDIDKWLYQLTSFLMQYSLEPIKAELIICNLKFGTEIDLLAKSKINGDIVNVSWKTGGTAKSLYGPKGKNHYFNLLKNYGAETHEESHLNTSISSGVYSSPHSLSSRRRHRRESTPRRKYTQNTSTVDSILTSPMRRMNGPASCIVVNDLEKAQLQQFIENKILEEEFSIYVDASYIVYFGNKTSLTGPLVFRESPWRKDSSVTDAIWEDFMSFPIIRPHAKINASIVDESSIPTAINPEISSVSGESERKSIENHKLKQMNSHREDDGQDSIIKEFPSFDVSPHENTTLDDRYLMTYS